MPEAVVAAHREAAGISVSMDALHAAASARVAEVCGTESGLVTAGAAAGLTLGAAAILCGYDLRRMEMLPHVDYEFPNEFVIAREQRNGYDHAVRTAGVRLVEVGMNETVAGSGVRRTEAWEYEAAFCERTAGVLYVYGHNSFPPLAEVVAVARQRGGSYEGMPADMWSMGVTIFTMFSRGELPFTGPDLSALINAVTHAEPYAQSRTPPSARAHQRGHAC